MPQVGDFTISVIDPDTSAPLDEYKVTTTNDKTECYIESIAEKQFFVSIHLDMNVRNRTSAYCSSLIIDGESIANKMLGNLGGTFFPNCKIKGAETGVNETRPFIFGNTNFTEDGKIDKNRLSKLGSITVRIRRNQVLGRQENQTPRVMRITESSINEKAKKALLTHSVKYGTPIQRERNCYWRTMDLDGGKPLHTITFLYRSRTILEALDIIVPEPTQAEEMDDSSDDASSGDDEDDDSADPLERIRKLKTELRELRELKRKVKQEPDAPPDVVDLTQPEVKKRKIVIDLTA